MVEEEEEEEEEESTRNMVVVVGKTLKMRRMRRWREG